MKTTWALKYRPFTWQDIFGQDLAVRFLKAVILESKYHSAYLLTGLYGCGKTTIARIFAKAVNCSALDGANPCNKCESCKTIDSDENVDYLELDGASSGTVDSIRKIKESVQYNPLVGKKKIFVIDECHAISGQAFQALLKTIEEAPAHVMFILATTEAHKVPDTISSRCMGVSLGRISNSFVVERLRFILEREKIKSDEEALVLIAKHAQGSMRDAVTMLEQVSILSNGNINTELAKSMLGIIDPSYYTDLLRSLTAKDLTAVVKAVDVLRSKGVQAEQVSKELAYLLNEVIQRKVQAAGTSPNEFGNVTSLFKSLTWLRDKLLRTWQSDYAALEIGLIIIAKEWDPKVVAVTVPGKDTEAADIKSLFSTR